jgi:formylglycine-generating enzyme required for sulfatase activity
MRRSLLCAGVIGLCLPGCERAGGEAAPAAKDAAPGPVPIRRPESFPACSTDYAPRPDRDAGPMCYVAGGTFDITVPGYYLEPRSERLEVDDFLIDQHEVTVDQFVRFLNEASPLPTCEHPENFCRPYAPTPAPPVDYLEGKFYSRPGFGAVAFDGATFELLEAYCVWAGKRVPTHFQWEVAAFYDPKGRRHAFPWGDEPDLSRMNCMEARCNDGLQDVAPPGSLRDVSPWGVVDLAGNADETVRGCRGDACDRATCDERRVCEHVGAGSGARGGAKLDNFHMKGIQTGVRCALRL